MQVVQCTSIVSACWGQLKPFLNRLKSSGLRIQEAEYLTTTYTSGKSSYPQRQGHDGPQHSTDTNDNNHHQQLQHHELVPIASGQGNMTNISASRGGDADSQSSQAMMIRETRTWRVSEAHPSERSDSL